MTSMKNYIDEMMDDNANGDQSDDNGPKSREKSEVGFCPYCHSEECIILIKKQPQGKMIYYTCPYCRTCWVIDTDPETGDCIGREISMSEIFPDNLK